MTKTAPAFLTLYNVGDHQSGAGVVASQTSTEKVLFDLEGKQVPGPNTNSIRIIQKEELEFGVFYHLNSGSDWSLLLNSNMAAKRIIENSN